MQSSAVLLPSIRFSLTSLFTGKGVYVFDAKNLDLFSTTMRNVVRYSRYPQNTQSWLLLRQRPSRFGKTLWHRHHSWPRFGPLIQRHGAKSKATVKLRDLPQGALELGPEAAGKEDEGPIFPTVVRQARNNMQKFDKCVVLTRVGSFYEVRSIWNPSIVSTDPAVALL